MGRTRVTAMKRKIRVYCLLSFSVLVLGITACSNGVQNTASQATGATIASSTEQSIPVTVTWKGGILANTSLARNLDPSVCTVAIRVYDASSGAEEGTGSLNSLGTGNGFAGTIIVNETGIVVFEAIACCSSGSVLDVARSNYTVTGTNDKVTVAASPVILEGGSIQGAALSLSTAVKTINSSNFSHPNSFTTDGTNLYVTDADAETISRIVISTGTVSTLAGAEWSSGSNDGTGIGAFFNEPSGITTDGTNLYVADTNNQTIRKIVISTGVVTTLAGKALTSGHADGTGTAATFFYPEGITTDGTNLYITDNQNCTIRKIVISTAVVSTLAGTADNSGRSDGTGAAASFSYPVGITTDGTNLYVADNQNGTIRKIVISNSVVTTFAGTAGYVGSVDGTGAAAKFGNPYGITTDGNNLFVTDESYDNIRQIVISTALVTTIAGAAGSMGYADGTGAAATFDYPEGITTDGTNLYIGDDGTGRIRRIQ